MGNAVIDGCYRYVLTRDVDSFGDGAVAFVMLNPSTADATSDDPTIRRCRGFARRLGFARLVVVNLFALRSTDPAEIDRAQDPVGRDNDDHIYLQTKDARMVIAAWGVPQSARVEQRADAVTRTLALTRDVHALGLSKDGHPRHPLYLRGDSEPVVYTPARGGKGAT